MADRLRLLFLTQCQPSLELGGSKSQLELAAALEQRGWHCQVAGPDASGIAAPADLLHQHWDVVDWDIHLAVERRLLPTSTLSLARIPFLNLHLRGGFLPWPLGPWRWRRRGQHLLRRWRGGRSEIQEMRDAQARVRHGLQQADLVNTWNSADTQLLIQQEGIAPERLIQMPPGLPEDRLQALASTGRRAEQRPPRLVTLATFDFRKGCLDLPPLLRQLHRLHPGLQLRLLGTCGLFRTEEEVRRFFPKHLQQSLEVITSFNAAELPRWLADADAGLFPSYLEGFGIGVIEQLAAGLPVFAYNVAGPCDSLPIDWLVPAGQCQLLAKRISDFLSQSPARQAEARRRACDRAQAYNLDRIADQWDQHYRQHLDRLRHGQEHQFR